MIDPLEGMTDSGIITTGARRSRVPLLFEPALGVAVASIRAADRQAVVYLYGSVATGQACPGRSDIDLLTLGLAAPVAQQIGSALSQRFAHVCRSVEIAPASVRDVDGEHDEAYGFRVFLRHYCVHLAGSSRYRPARSFAADTDAARGFNGDIDRCAQRWREQLDTTSRPDELGTRIARKTLLAVAGLVSVHDRTWTTDRRSAARRWSEIAPDLAYRLSTLASWTDGASGIRHRDVERALDSTVGPVVSHFAEHIGLWRDRPV